MLRVRPARFSRDGTMSCVAGLLGAALLSACGGSDGLTSGEALPHATSFPRPVAPADNPTTPAKVALGRHLFHDVRLSGNGTQSCGTCHQQALAFSDGRATALGSTGQAHPRNSPSLANAAFNLTQGWGDPTLTTLEAQHLTPLTGTDPVEMGINDANRDEVLTRFRNDPAYARMFAAAFPGEDEPVTLGNMVKAIASFSRTIISNRSPFDRFAAGEDAALTPGARRGLALFESERLECTACHGGFNFSDSTRVTGDEIPAFHNTGLYNIAASLDGPGDNYPPRNQGLFHFTGAPADKGRMKAPTLRNVALTAPYGHDGSVATLDEVIDNYARGGRLVLAPPDRAGDGRSNRNKDGEIHGFALSAAEKADLLEFLDSLTDADLVTDPRLSDPFQGAAP
jgi:cytochrome c peroxidase